MQRFLNLIVKYGVYLLVFLLPLFFLPFSFEAFEFNKQYLLFFLSTLAFFAWLAKMIVCDKEIRFRSSPLDYFVLGFMVLAILSTVFSVDTSSSLYGFYGRFSDGLISFLSMGILYFLITNNTGTGEDKKTLKIGGILKAILWSSGLIVLFSYFSIFGVFAKLGQWLSLPALIQQSTFNTVTGSLEGLSVFLAVIICLLVGMMASSKSISKIKNFGYWLLLLGSLGLMVIIDFTASWIILLAALVSFVVLSLWKRIFKENVNKLLVPVSLSLISVLCIVLNPMNLILSEDSSLSNLPKEQVLSQEMSWDVSFKASIDSVKNGFLGSGLGTFHHDFAKYKPIEINNSWLWQIRFDRPGSYFAEILATMGFLGLLAYVALIGIFLVIGGLLLKGIKDISETYPFQIPLLLVFLALLASQFVYYQNTTLGFIFWLVLGLSMVSWKKPVKERVKTFNEFPELSLIFSTIVIIFGIAILAVYFFAVKFYLADVNYSKAIGLLGEQRVEYLTSAIKLNPYSARYHSAISLTYLYEALQEMQKATEEQNTAQIQTLVAQSIEEAKTTSILQKNQVASWENLGVVYREIILLAQGAADWGIDSFKNALKYEPTNPVLYTEIGKLYAAKGEIESAKEFFKKAKEMKSDYAEATIQMALLLESEDILDQAITELEELVIGNPLNVDARFQLGRLYFNNNQKEEAIEQFKIVILLVPDHSNANYSLGIAYAAQNEIELAIAQFEKVLELNPGNQDVMQKINDLKGEEEE